ncbi:MAG: cell division protein FtsA [Bacteroidales bacterium]|nr:cell division protein FtsA [Bacteroidales bacterium]
MEERYIACIDPGTSKIALTVAKVDRDDIQVLYYKETPSDGIRYSCIFNPGRAAGPIGKAIKDAEEELKIKILQVVVGLPRYEVHQEKAPGSLERTDPGSCISQEEVDTLKELAMEAYPLADQTTEKVFGAVAQSFSTDDLIRMPERDIVGAISSSLEGNFTIFIGRKSDVNNLEMVFQKLGIAIAETFFVPDVTADAVLTREEMDNGVALIDLGAGASSVTIFQNGIMRHYGSIPFGAGNITSDIRFECAFTEQLAENIKLGFGACLPEKLQSLSDKTLQISDPDDGTSQNLSVKYLSEIITARQKEIFEAMLFEIGRSGYSTRLRSGIVLTGGGAQLVNCGNLLKSMSGYNVRIAYPQHRHFNAAQCPEIMDTSATASVGMLLRAAKLPYLNCVESPEGEVELENPAQETAPGQPYDGTVFEDHDKTVESEKKPKKPTRRTGKVTFGRSLMQKLGDVVGNLYDGMQ